MPLPGGGGRGEKASRGGRWAPPRTLRGPGKERKKRGGGWARASAWRWHGPTNGMSMRKLCPGLLGHGETSWIFKPATSPTTTPGKRKAFKAQATIAFASTRRQRPRYSRARIIASQRVKLPACTPASFLPACVGPACHVLLRRNGVHGGADELGDDG